MNNQMNVAAEDEDYYVTLHSNKIIGFGSSNVFYLAYVISLSLVALGYLLAFVFTGAVSGFGVAVSTMVSSFWGHLLRAQIYAPILIALVFVLISGWRLFAKKNDKIYQDTKMLAFFPTVMEFFAIFALIDSIFIAFVTIVKSGYGTLDTILNFLGYDSLDFFLSMVDPEAESAGAFEIIVSVFFGLFFVAFAFGLVMLYLKMKRYHHSIANYALRGNYEIESNPPIIFAFVFAGLYIALAVFAFIAGNWVTGIIDIALASYFATSALLFRSVHAYLISK